MAQLSQNPNELLRIVDANLNRAGEGLRVIEDIARMVLDNRDLSVKLKALRHGLVQTSPSFQQALIESRDSATDVGRNIEIAGEGQDKDTESVLIANARRVQESLRVLEEMAKVEGMAGTIDPEQFKQARFEVYSLEQELVSLLSRQDKLKHLAGLYVVLDSQWLGGRSHVEVARQAISGGARTIQLREKTMKKKDLVPLARRVREICKEGQALFIMNDYLDVALDSGADGLHVGQDDLPAAVARRLLRRDQILGCSVRTVEEALAAQWEGADYLGVGAVFPTSSKGDATVIGLGKLKEIVQAVTIPVVAIGGLTVDNVHEVIVAGAVSAAVISAVVGAASPEDAAKGMVSKIEAKA